MHMKFRKFYFMESFKKDASQTHPVDKIPESTYNSDKIQCFSLFVSIIRKELTQMGEYWIVPEFTPSNKTGEELDLEIKRAMEESNKLTDWPC